MDRARVGTRTVAVLLAMGWPAGGLEAQEPFPPVAPERFRVVNSVAFSPTGDEIYFAARYGPYLVNLGQRPDSAPATAMFSVRRVGAEWGSPELVDFSGRFQDYEPTVSADGRTMVFNSRRPYPDGRVPERNDLWMSTRNEAGGWTDPVHLSSLTTFEHEESYASLSADGVLVYLRGRPADDGSVQYDLFQSRMEGGEFRTSERHPVSTERWGEGDPWLARDGSYLIFTRWDEAVGWTETVDLFVSFRDGDVWSDPVPLTELNSSGPDYGPAVSPDGQWLYYRRDSRFRRVPLAEVLKLRG